MSDCEYIVELLDTVDGSEELEKRLNALGAKGWELVAVHSYEITDEDEDLKCLAFLKREKSR